MPLTVRQRSINTKNGIKRLNSFNKGKKPKKGLDGEVLVTNAPTDLRSISYPGGVVALLLLCISKLSSAYFGIITDCDETYNYWEPLHYLLYGSGLQTWEYSPEYAIRSYASLWIFAVPAKILTYLTSSMYVFYVLRLHLAICAAVTDLMFYKAVCSEFGVHVGRVWLALTLPAAGCFIASTAMLPSSWSGILATAALACWWRRDMAMAVFLTAVNTLLSWPFAALIGIPIALDMLIVRPKIMQFIKYSFISLLIIIIPTIAVDSWHYGKLVIAPLNIVAYNIFTNHGPDLYGVEPWTYYFVNGFLNFNIVWVVSLSCPLLLVACWFVISGAAPRASFCAPYWLSLMPLYLWLAVFMLQPHKEERFLYPVYSMIVLCAAISVDCIQKLCFAVWTEVLRRGSRRRGGHYLSYTAPLMWMCILIAAIGGISRSVSLYRNYNAPMSILHQLPAAPTERTYVCFGKDWYRSPSSFHLPDDHYRIRFIKSSFSGQLPAPYTERYNGTRLIHRYFNNQNKEDQSTYLAPKACHYLIDSDIGRPNILEPFYFVDDNHWQIIAKYPILDSAKSHKLLRAFYVPIISDVRNVFANLYLLRNKNLTAGW